MYNVMDDWNYHPQWNLYTINPVYTGTEREQVENLERMDHVNVNEAQHLTTERPAVVKAVSPVEENKSLQEPAAVVDTWTTGDRFLLQEPKSHTYEEWEIVVLGY
jgi:hypothetical protein